MEPKVRNLLFIALFLEFSVPFLECGILWLCRNNLKNKHGYTSPTCEVHSSYPEPFVSQTNQTTNHYNLQITLAETCYRYIIFF